MRVCVDVKSSINTWLFFQSLYIRSFLSYEIHNLTSRASQWERKTKSCTRSYSDAICSHLQPFVVIAKFLQALNLSLNKKSSLQVTDDSHIWAAEHDLLHQEFPPLNGRQPASLFGAAALQPRFGSLSWYNQANCIEQFSNKRLSPFFFFLKHLFQGI